MFAGKWNEFLNSKMGGLARLLYLVGAFCLLDIWLRFQTRWIGAYSIYEPAPNLFTLAWSVLLVSLITIIPSQRVGRLVFAGAYSLSMLYAVIQYGAYLVLGKFLYASDFLLAGEGADYASWVIDLLSPWFVVQIVAIGLVGAVGVRIYPSCGQRSNDKKDYIVRRVLTVFACAISFFAIPCLYGTAAEENKWNDFDDPVFEYRQFTNANFDLELTGMYQFFVRDIQVQLHRGANREERAQIVQQFFAEKEDHPDNAMTDIFEGKNLIVVMMETVDDWVITEKDTPTLYRMKTEGISFENMYTPQYSNGYTFNTEFAFNVSVYPYSNGNVAYSLIRSCFENSIANRFAAKGYSAHSYHAGLPSFYNRAQMHMAWGYEAYHSYQDYPEESVLYQDDRYLTESDMLYGDVVAQAPFFSFVITLSPHLPFTDEDEVARIALDAYPEYDVQENREEAILRAKARLTDDMFAGLLERLAEDGMLEDTVIAAFGDHYAYGLSDREHLLQLSEEAGSPILEKTPAFIYCAGCDLSAEVEKVTQITDFAPTILNLFGIEVPKEIMGRDIFDDDYEGYAIFANGTWLTSSAYVKNGVIQWNHGMTDEEIKKMNAFVHEVYQVNDAILDSDYYALKEE